MAVSATSPGVAAELPAEFGQRRGMRVALWGRMPDGVRQDLRARAFRLSAEVFKMYPRLAAAGSGHAFLAGQLLRAATSIGANLEEGAAASSRRDMASKYSIALREAREANYWARLGATDPRWADELAPLIQETHEFVAMLTVSVKKLRIPAMTQG